MKIQTILDARYQPADEIPIFKRFELKFKVLSQRSEIKAIEDCESKMFSW